MSLTKAQDLMRQVNGALKTEALRMASDKKFIVDYMPTGLVPIDILMQGGIPRGRFVAIQGDFSTLKSFVGLNAIAQEQKRGGVCALIDTEHAFDPSWAETIGVDRDNLIIQHPDSGEKAIDTAEVLIRGGLDLLVFDSVAAMLPDAERKKRLYDESVQPARIAQLMSVACRKLTTANDRCGIVWINQLREQVGVTFGNPEKATGGRALPYYSSMILDIKKAGKVTRPTKVYDGEKWKDSKEQVAQTFRATIQKSKLNKPFREIIFDWSLEQTAIDQAKFIFTQGVEIGAVVQKGSRWNVAGGRKQINGRENFIKFLAATPAAMQAVTDKVMAHHGLTYLGAPGPGNNKVGNRKSSRPNDVARKSTPTVGRGRSRPTRATVKSSSSSRIRKARLTY